ncbi:hypothetical protein CTAYLR_010706 [Chrysophaeum taylorii]|uniref:AFG1-like ATPase n=1 Tax=Chrysophaeum taylorii TaxID=2483200 RepID=A0AAD7XR46_9STRA|nr:hypothetical protein CTAYLR_010706 [Chrysophaeum taylorii]
MRRWVSSLLSPLERWTALVERGGLRRDEAQVPVVRALDTLHATLRDYDAAIDMVEARRRLVEERTPLRPLPRGLYIHGDVGVGKSFCMDLFYNGLSSSSKRRCHFHEFMLDVHRRAARSSSIASVGRDLAAEAAVLCLDEFQVIDVADAMILRRLFDAVWGRGGVVVATSNRAPYSLYENGLNYEYFAPFVGQLRRHCRVLELRSSRDHRLEFADSTSSRVARPRDARSWLDGALRDALGGNSSPPVTTDLAVGSRRLAVPTVLRDGRRAAVFEFDVLCDADLGAADFAAIASAFDVVALLHVPRLDLKRHDVARRFITLIDCLYEARVTVLVAAETHPRHLFSTTTTISDTPPERGKTPRTLHPVDPAAAAADPVVDDDDDYAAALELDSVRELPWAFRRAASRLVEMASPAWPASALVSRRS